MKSVKTLADDIAEAAANMIKEHGTLGPIIILITESDNLLFFPVDTKNYETKSKSVLTAKLAAMVYPARYSIIAMEAWCKRVKEGQYDGTPPSQCSDREEVLVISIEDHKGNREYQQYNLIRNDDGSLAGTEKIETEVFDAVEGLFIGILDGDGEIDMKPFKAKRMREKIRRLQAQFKQERRVFNPVLH